MYVELNFLFSEPTLADSSQDYDYGDGATLVKRQGVAYANDRQFDALGVVSTYSYRANTLLQS